MDMINRKKELGRQLATVRVAHGVSQEAMATMLNVSRGTVANWEMGKANPDIFQTEDWYDSLGEDPVYHLDYYRHPELYEKHDTDIGEVMEDLFRILRDQAPALIVRQLHFLAAGRHGSNRDAFMQEVCAVLQLPLYMRHSLAVMASSMYKLAKANGLLNCPDDVQPDIELLDAASSAGFAAAENGNGAYTLHGKRQ